MLRAWARVMAWVRVRVSSACVREMVGVMMTTMLLSSQHKLSPTSPPRPCQQNGKGEGEEGLWEGGLCYDDNYVVVIITQTVSLTLAIFGGEGKGDSLCYDDNYVVVIITQAVSVAPHHCWW